MNAWYVSCINQLVAVIAFKNDHAYVKPVLLHAHGCPVIRFTDSRDVKFQDDTPEPEGSLYILLTRSYALLQAAFVEFPELLAPVNLPALRRLTPLLTREQLEQVESEEFIRRHREMLVKA